MSAEAATRTWAGSGANSFWTNSANWSGSVAPVNGDTLIFPAGVPRTVNTNTAGAPSAFQSISLFGSNYVIYAPGLTITNDFTNHIAFGTNILNAPLTLASSLVRFRDTNTAAWLIINSNINLNGNSFFPSHSGVIQVNGAITGSGSAIHAGTGSTLLLNGSNTFGGTFTLNGGTLGGDGYVPSITAAGGQINPGAPTNAFGLLRCTGNLVLNGGDLMVDVTSTGAGSGSDQLLVTGNVALTNASLICSARNMTTTSSVTILKNDGVSAVAGTFLGLAEGAVFTNGHAVLKISYVGGDGNDITLQKIGSAVFVWDGGGADSFWSNPTNWVGDQLPPEYSALVFPAGAARVNNTNTTIGYNVFESITFTGSNYVLNLRSANGLFIRTGITNAVSGKTNIIIGDVHLFTSCRFETANALATLRLDGIFDQAYLLTVSGAGKTIINSSFAGGASFIKEGSGTLYLNGTNTSAVYFTGSNGMTVVNGNFANFTGTSFDIYSAATLAGTGQVYDANIKSGGVLSPGLSGAGTLSIRDLTLESGGSYAVNLDGPTAVEADQVVILSGGSLAISNATLSLSQNYVPTPGDAFTLISVPATATTTGSFSNHAEGTLFNLAGGETFQISYRAGASLRDVVIRTAYSVPTGGTRVWDGDSGSTDWATPGNWVSGVPLPGDSAHFPVIAINGRRSPTQNQPGYVALNAIYFGGDGFNFLTTNGGSLLLAGGILATNARSVFLGANDFRLPVGLQNSQSFTVNPSNSLAFHTPVNLLGNKLTLTGGGDFLFYESIAGPGTVTNNTAGRTDIYGTNSISGGLILNNGTHFLWGAFTNTPPIEVNSTNCVVYIRNSVPGLLARAGNIWVFSGLVRSEGNFTLGSNVVYFTDGNPATTLTVNGSVNLASARLSLSIFNNTLPGTVFANILNDGADPIVGTFAGLPEGAVTNYSGSPVRISYTGGDGNDLTFTIPARPSFTNVTMLANGRCQLFGSGAAGVPIIIQASTNLVDWTSLFTNSVAGGTFTFTDTNAPSFRHRFYRALFQ